MSPLKWMKRYVFLNYQTAAKQRPHARVERHLRMLLSLIYGLPG